MAVNLAPPQALLAVPGVQIGTACAGIKQTERHDLAVFHFCQDTVVAGVYTQSHFAAAPVQLAKQREQGCRGWLVNSGNANAATGSPGLQDARALCTHLATQVGVAEQSIQPFSTGVIGERLPVAAMQTAIDTAAASLNQDRWLNAAEAIMTTDTVAKGVSATLLLGDVEITITGIAKGSGMIKPDMATMLAYVACDAPVSQVVADHLISVATQRSFNRITVDGDTSTNDCFMLACTGRASISPIIELDDPRADILAAALTELTATLAQNLVRDGEGATKFITVQVNGGANAEECLAVAYTVAESPLVKTAMFAGDANWGRFCMAIGRAPVAELDPAGVCLWLDDVQVAAQGLMCESYREAQGAAVLAQAEFTVTIDLGRGQASECVWTSDLSYEYVRINAEYRT